MKSDPRKLTKCSPGLPAASRSKRNTGILPLSPLRELAEFILAWREEYGVDSPCDEIPMSANCFEVCPCASVIRKSFLTLGSFVLMLFVSATRHGPMFSVCEKPTIFSFSRMPDREKAATVIAT